MRLDEHICDIYTVNTVGVDKIVHLLWNEVSEVSEVTVVVIGTSACVFVSVGML